MYWQVEVRKFILGEWFKNHYVQVNSMAKKYKVQRKTVSCIIKSWGEGRGLERKSSNQDRGPQVKNLIKK